MISVKKKKINRNRKCYKIFCKIIPHHVVCPTVWLTDLISLVLKAKLIRLSVIVMGILTAALTKLTHMSPFVSKYYVI